ncbi:MAG: zf-HC2 domain-containing protein [Oscillospiraceae bacterium]|nr:zf-HC2 domain-containing protein [Oscillospiraceae bacterium]
MICSYYQELISRMLDEDLSPVEQGVLEAHLPNCEACAAMYKSFSALSQALEDQLEEPPESLRYNVMAEIRRAEIRKKNRLSRPMKIILSTAACLALIVGISMGSGVLRPKGAASSANTVMLAESSIPTTRSATASQTTAADSDDADAFYEITDSDEAAAFSDTANSNQAAKLYDAAEAEEVSAPYAAAESAAGAVSNGARTADSGASAFDLSDRLSKEELLDFLGRGNVDLAVQPDQLLYQVIVADGDGYDSLWFYEQDGELFYALSDGGLYLAGCDRAALEAFLSE